MDEKVITRKFHSHDAPDIFFKFDDTGPIELPRRVGDFRRDQLPADGRIETESGGQKNIQQGWGSNRILLCNSDSCLCLPASLAEIHILPGTNIHAHFCAKVRQAEYGTRSNDSEQLGGIQREEPNARTVRTADVRPEIYFRKCESESVRKQWWPQAGQ